MFLLKYKVINYYYYCHKSLTDKYKILIHEQAKCIKYSQKKTFFFP